MGRLFLIVALAGAMFLGGSDPDPGPYNASPSVTLMSDATPEQVAAVEAKVRAIPRVLDVVRLDGPEQLAAMKETWKDDPDMLAQLSEVDPAHLPWQIAFKFRDRAATLRHFTETTVPAELRRMPGVDGVGVPMRTGNRSVSECMVGPDRLPGAPESLTVKAFLAMDATDDEKQALRERLERVPGARSVTLTSREQALAEYRELLETVPDGPNAKAEDLPESWVLKVGDYDDVRAAQEAGLREELCRMTGVNAVLVPPKNR